MSDLSLVPSAGRKRLTPRQQKFVAEFLKHGNATKAAERAGYTKNRANQAGYQVLTNPDVAAEVEERRKRVLQEIDVDAEMIAAELARCGFANMEDFTRIVNGDPVPDFSGVTRDKMAAVQEVTVDTYMDGKGDDAREVKRVKFRLTDKRQSLVDLAKLLGFWKEKHEHDVKHSWHDVLKKLEDDPANGRG